MIYKGQNSENLLQAITFDWSVFTDLRSTPLSYISNALFSDTPLPYLLSCCVFHICHITCVTCVTYVTCQVSCKVGKWGIPEKSIKNASQRHRPIKDFSYQSARWDVSGNTSHKVKKAIALRMLKSIQGRRFFWLINQLFPTLFLHHLHHRGQAN